MSDYERRFPTNCEDIAFVIRELSEKRLQVSLFYVLVQPCKSTSICYSCRDVLVWVAVCSNHLMIHVQKAFREVMGRQSLLAVIIVKSS